MSINDNKAARDVSSNELPSTMYIRKSPINKESLPETFAKFFNDKIETISRGVNIDEGVYNGVKKVNPENKMLELL